MKTFFHNFIKCGTIGWCMEIIFTALNSLRRHDYRLTGITSLWMFPIYGCAALLKPISHLLKKLPIWTRGLTYMCLIFTTEYVSGALLNRHKLRPWDYCRSRFNIHSNIRLDFAPLWFAAGLLFEQILKPSAKHPQ